MLAARRVRGGWEMSVHLELRDLRAFVAAAEEP
jgi:hypothetical protein